MSNYQSLKTIKLKPSQKFCNSLFSRYNNVNYSAWHVYKPLFGTSVAICRPACSEISLSIDEKKAREKSRERSDIIQFGKWRDGFSSSLCFVL